MSLLDRLRAFGNKLGILHIDAPHDVYVPIKITTRTVSLAELEFEVVAVPTIDNNAALNESFATYMEHLAMHEVTEFNESWLDFFTGTKQWAYWQDRLITSHPTEAQVNSVSE